MPSVSAYSIKLQHRERSLHNTKQEESAVLPVQREMKLFDFQTTPDGGGSERLMGKYFHNMFVLLIKSKSALEGTRESGVLRKCGFKLKTAGTSNTAGMRRRLYHSPHSKILNVRPLTSTTTVISFC